jgi:hypothetical protein
VGRSIGVVTDPTTPLWLFADQLGEATYGGRHA